MKQTNCVGNAIKSYAYECLARTILYVAERARASKNDDDRVIRQGKHNQREKEKKERKMSVTRRCAFTKDLVVFL